ncbi:MAG: hypothetical protein ACR2PR_06110 [Pseudohongiellaceae bacterium]
MTDIPHRTLRLLDGDGFCVSESGVGAFVFCIQRIDGQWFLVRGGDASYAVAGQWNPMPASLGQWKFMSGTEWQVVICYHIRDSSRMTIMRAEKWRKRELLRIQKKMEKNNTKTKSCGNIPNAAADALKKMTRPAECGAGVLTKDEHKHG